MLFPLSIDYDTIDTLGDADIVIKCSYGIRFLEKRYLNSIRNILVS